MRQSYLVLYAASVLVLGGCATAQRSANQPKEGIQTAQTYSYKKTSAEKMNYLLFLPKGYESKKEERWPLMLFLHGAGERGQDLKKVTVHGPPKLVTKDPEFPFILVSPQCPENQIWSREQLLALLQDVKQKYRVDSSRIYLTGLSMGGYGSWDLGLSHPELFAAIVPICGGGEFINVLLSSDPVALRSLGVWAFHGGKDPVVPLSESERMVDFLKQSGVREAQLTVYPEAGHDAWTQTYENPELYRWLLEHRRPVKK